MDVFTHHHNALIEFHATAHHPGHRIDEFHLCEFTCELCAIFEACAGEFG